MLEGSLEIELSTLNFYTLRVPDSYSVVLMYFFFWHLSFSKAFFFVNAFIDFFSLFVLFCQRRNSFLDWNEEWVSNIRQKLSESQIPYIVTIVAFSN